MHIWYSVSHWTEDYLVTVGNIALIFPKAICKRAPCTLREPITTNPWLKCIQSAIWCIRVVEYNILAVYNIIPYFMVFKWSTCKSLCCYLRDLSIVYLCKNIVDSNFNNLFLTHMQSLLAMETWWRRDCCKHSQQFSCEFTIDWARSFPGWRLCCQIC